MITTLHVTIELILLYKIEPGTSNRYQVPTEMVPVTIVLMKHLKSCISL